MMSEKAAASGCVGASSVLRFRVSEGAGVLRCVCRGGICVVPKCCDVWWRIDWIKGE